MDAILEFTAANYVFHQAAGAYRYAMLNQGDYEILGTHLIESYTALKRAAPAALRLQPDLQRVLATAANDYRQCRQMEPASVVTFTVPIFTAAPPSDTTASPSDKADATQRAAAEATAREAAKLRQYFAEQVAQQVRTARHLRYVALFAVSPIILFGVWLDATLLFTGLGAAVAGFIMREQIANYWHDSLERITTYPPHADR
jgi:hypothetical protein